MQQQKPFNVCMLSKNGETQKHVLYNFSNEIQGVRSNFLSAPPQVGHDPQYLLAALPHRGVSRLNSQHQVSADLLQPGCFMASSRSLSSLGHKGQPQNHGSY